MLYTLVECISPRPRDGDLTLTLLECLVIILPLRTNFNESLLSDTAYFQLSLSHSYDNKNGIVCVKNNYGATNFIQTY